MRRWKEEGKTDEFRFASVRPLFSHTIYLAYCAGGERERKEEEEEEATSFPSSTRDFSFLDPIVSRRLLEKRTKKRHTISHIFLFYLPPIFKDKNRANMCVHFLFHFFPVLSPAPPHCGGGGVWRGGEEKKKKVSFRSGKSISKKKGREGAARPSPYTLVPLEGGRPPL